MKAVGSWEGAAGGGGIGREMGGGLISQEAGGKARVGRWEGN